MYVQAQHLAGLKNGMFRSSLDLYMFKLSVWLASKIMSLTTFQTHICIGLVLVKVITLSLVTLLEKRIQVKEKKC
jgi:hypothetical protein